LAGAAMTVRGVNQAFISNAAAALRASRAAIS
jgi:hypothetical protein